MKEKIAKTGRKVRGAGE